MNAFTIQVSSISEMIPNSLTACRSYIFPYISTKPGFLLNLDSLFRSVMAFERCRSHGTRLLTTADAPPLPREAFVIDRLSHDSGLQQAKCKKNTHPLFRTSFRKEGATYIYIYIVYMLNSLISVLIEGNHLVLNMLRCSNFN